jgi:hypothetical protein
MYYVYAHYIEGEDKPFYIGKGKNNRAYDYTNRSSKWLSYVCGRKVRTELIVTGLPENSALSIESKFINHFKLLVNVQKQKRFKKSKALINGVFMYSRGIYDVYMKQTGKLLYVPK